MTRCHENESCSKVLNFLERLDDRIGCAHEETVTVIKPREDVGANKSLGCIFSEKFQIFFLMKLDEPGKPK